MKKLLVLCYSLLTVFAIQAQTADEVIAKHIDAIGGKDALVKVQSIIKEGTLNMNGMDVALKLTQSHNVGYRNDISVMGMSGYQIVTPKEGWKYMPFGGNAELETMSADELKEGQDNLDCQSPLLNYADKGSKVELLGSEKIEGADCFNLKLTMASGKVKNYFINKENFLLTKATNFATVNGQEMPMEITYSNYKKVDGIMYAYTMVRPQGELNIEKVTVNSKLDESIFKPSK